MATNIDKQIRDAVSAGELSKASELWDTYAAYLAGEIRAGNGSEAKLDQVRNLMEWTRGVTACAQAHAEQALNSQRTSLHAAAVYGQPTGRY